MVDCSGTQTSPCHPPFIAIDKDGYLYGFITEHQLTHELEAVDVLSGEYRVYDLNGREISLEIDARERITLHAENAWADVETVKEMLIRFRSECNVPVPTEGDDMKELISSAASFLREK